MPDRDPTRIYSLQKKWKNSWWFIQNVVFLFVVNNMNRFEAIGCFQNFYEGILKAVAEAE
jgi:hypothetical protein